MKVRTLRKICGLPVGKSGTVLKRAYYGVLVDLGIHTFPNKTSLHDGRGKPGTCWWLPESDLISCEGEVVLDLLRLYDAA